MDKYSWIEEIDWSSDHVASIDRNFYHRVKYRRSAWKKSSNVSKRFDSSERAYRFARMLVAGTGRPDLSPIESIQVSSFSRDS